VVAANKYGSATSAVVTVTVLVPATITSQPATPVNLLQGVTLSLTVGAGGAGPLTWQWFVNSVPLTNGANISGVATSNLVINPAFITNSGSYLVVVSNAFSHTNSKVSFVTVSADTTLPGVKIASPATDGTRSNVTAWTFSGTASDNVRVTNVIYWITNLNGAPLVGPVAAVLSAGTGSASNWTVTVSPPAGSNVFAVQSVDFSGNLSTIQIRKFFAKSPVPLALHILGTGSGTFTGTTSISGDTNVPAIGAKLNVGQSYTITAVPDSRSYFTTWTGTAGTSNALTLDFTMQSNTSLNAYFITNMFLGMAGNYNGLFSSSALGVTEETAGMIAGLALKTNGVFTASLWLDGSSPTLSGTFSHDGYWSNLVSTALDKNVAVELYVDSDIAPRTISGFVAGTNIIQVNGTNQAGWMSQVQLIASLTNSSNLYRNYTMLIPPRLLTPTAIPEDIPALVQDGSPVAPKTQPVPASPPGYGYALLTNAAATATVNLTGALADGTAISQSVPIGEDNGIALYPSPYNTATNGLLFGRLSLEASPGPGLGIEAPGPLGFLTWIRKASASGPFKAGFTNDLLEVQGSPWVSSTMPMPPGSLLTLSGGGLTNALTFGLTMSGTNLVPAVSDPYYKSGYLNTNTGLMSVTFTNNANAAVTAHGVLLLDNQFGGGFYASPSASPTNFGSFTFEP
jgi:hypothetical protein